MTKEFPRIEVNPEKLNGRPCIKGTRIRVYDYLSHQNIPSAGFYTLRHLRSQTDYERIFSHDAMGIKPIAKDRDFKISLGGVSKALQFYQTINKDSKQ